MNKLFGIPTVTLAAVLAVALVAVLALVGGLALRNRIFLRLGIRSVGRRRGRSTLIVVGLMLGTAIIAAALATGDTMSSTIRSSAVKALGDTDEVVAAKGLEEALTAESAGTAARYFPQSFADRVSEAVAGTDLVDGVAPTIVEDIAVLNVRTSQHEPRVTLFATDPAQMRGFGEIRSDGKVVSLGDLGPREIYLNRKAASELDARAGDTVQVFIGQRREADRIKAVVSYKGGATDGDGVLMTLSHAQQLVGKPGLIRAIFVSNTNGVSGTDSVIRRLQPVVSPLGLETDNTKEDALDTADTMGAAFMSMFTTFGSFSIAAGILLIFLIFVMLAAERRSELGIARAVGTRRGHLVQMFVYEGLAYDLIAAVVGALIGIGVAYLMVLAIASAFGGLADISIGFSVKPASIVIAYAIGVLLTFAVVAFAARRVSRMNIVSAIRSIEDPPSEKSRRRRWLFGLAGVLLGSAVVLAGSGSDDGVAIGLGVTLVILGLVPLARMAHLPDRAVHTGAGLALVLWFVLPFTRWIFGDTKQNFGIFVLAGLAIVIGATWTIMYNADVLLRALGAVFGRIPAVAPVMRMSIAYPLRGLFRTGVTLAMFTLVVFTLVVGAITTGSFVHAFNDINRFSGGFDVRATTSPASPVADMRTAIARAQGLRASDFRIVSDQSLLPVKARQTNAAGNAESYVVHGVDNAFLDNTTYRFAATARGYATPAAVWRAVRDHPGLAVTDALVAPRKAQWGFGPMPDFKLHGFYLEDKKFDPIPVTIRDPQTGRERRLTVIGVLSDTAPEFMVGLWTSQRTLAAAFGDRVLPTVHLFALGPGVDAKATARKLEASFLASGMEADSMQKLLDDAVGASLTFDRLIEGFMGLGLIVGVAALGVITARSVVERRQHIGVLRAIGFRRRMVQLAFLLESSFVALTAIVVGAGLGIVVGRNVIVDARRFPSWEGMSLEIPWLMLGGIFLVVYLVALATTWAPALRASRIYPAEALRYQ
jgi:putative ABC transport system permease protein